MPIFFCLVILFVIWTRYEISKTNKKAKLEDKAYFERERKANLSRRSSIENLPYLHISLDRFPMDASVDEHIQEFQNQLTCLSQQKMLDLSGLSNTDLKLQYGIQNLDALTEYEQSFIDFLNLCTNWSQYLFDQEDYEHAQEILLYMIEIHSDVRAHYRLLATIYQKLGKQQQLESLMHDFSTFFPVPK